MLAGGSYWRIILGATPREIVRNLIRTPPLFTVIFVGACIGLYYYDEDAVSTTGASLSYVPGDRADLSYWYTPVTAILMHLSDAHLLSNMVVLLTSGLLLEVTEGSVHLMLVSLASGVIGAGYHGLYSSARVRGASGAIYGILWSQISLLLLNFAEMPGRWLRTLVALVLLGAEMATYQLQHDDRVSYQAHLFGALAGTFVSLISGRNVVFWRWEILLNVVGAIGYVGLLVPIVYSGQWSCVIWASAITPLLVYAMLDSGRRAVLHRATSTGEAHAWAAHDQRQKARRRSTLRSLRAPTRVTADVEDASAGRRVRIAPCGHAMGDGWTDAPQMQHDPRTSDELPRAPPPPAPQWPPPPPPQMPVRWVPPLPPRAPLPDLPPPVPRGEAVRAHAPSWPPTQTSANVSYWPPGSVTIDL